MLDWVRRIVGAVVGVFPNAAFLIVTQVYHGRINFPDIFWSFGGIEQWKNLLKACHSGPSLIPQATISNPTPLFETHITYELSRLVDLTFQLKVRQ